MIINTNNIIGAEAIIIKHSELSKIYDLLGLLDDDQKLKKYSASITELSLILKSIFIREIPSENLETKLVVHEIAEYCLNLKGYFFVGNSFFDKTEYVKRLNSKQYDLISGEISFISMIENAVIKAIEYRDSTEKFNKVDFIGICYTTLQDYKIYSIHKRFWDNLSHYKLTVITGLIAFKIKPDCYKSFQDLEINEDLPPEVIKNIVASNAKKFVKARFLKKKVVRF